MRIFVISTVLGKIFPQFGLIGENFSPVNIYWGKLFPSIETDDVKTISNKIDKNPRTAVSPPAMKQQGEIDDVYVKDHACIDQMTFCWLYLS